MKRVLMACAALAGLALAAPAWAQMEQPFVPSDQGGRPWEAGHTVPYTGMGELVGSAALPGGDRLLIVQPRVTSQTFLTSRTQVVDAHGNALPRTALEDGQRVKVDFDLRGNTAIARRVTVLAQPEPLPSP